MKSKIIITLISTALFFLSAEVALRLAHFRRDPGHFRNVSLTFLYGMGKFFPRREKVVQTDRTGYDIKYRISAAGFRGAPAQLDFRALAALPAPKIAVLGGSFVFDIFQADERTWPAQLESRLHALPGLSEVRVINAGMPGSSLIDIASRVSYELPLLKPRMVVISSLWNDLQFLNSREPLIDLTPDPQWRGHFLHYYGLVDKLFCDVSLTYGLVRFFWVRHEDERTPLKPFNMSAFISLSGPRNGKLSEGPTEEALYQYRILWKNVLAAVRNMGAIPVVLIEPNFSIADSPLGANSIRTPNYRADYSHAGIIRSIQAAREIQRDLAKEGVLVLDYSDSFARNGRLLRDQLHVSEEGASFLAEKISSAIAALPNRSVRLRTANPRTGVAARTYGSPQIAPAL